MPSVLENGVAETHSSKSGDTRRVHRSSRPSNVEIRADDSALIGHAGLFLTGELAAHMDSAARLNRAIHAIRPLSRRDGAAAAVVASAELMLVGGDHLVHLDKLCEDEGGTELRAVSEVVGPTKARLGPRGPRRVCVRVLVHPHRPGERHGRDRALAPAAGPDLVGAGQGGQALRWPTPLPTRLDANRARQTAGVIAHNLVALLSAMVANVNHRRLRDWRAPPGGSPPRQPCCCYRHARSRRLLTDPGLMARECRVKYATAGHDAARDVGQGHIPGRP